MRGTKLLKKVCVPVIAAGAAIWATASVRADVVPAEYVGELLPGESVTITKTVTLPEDTPKLDFVLLVDLTGSYYDDLPNIKARASDLFDQISAGTPDAKFGLATFKDFPFAPWGGSTDYAYDMEQDLTTDKTLWMNAINAMYASGGADTNEAQLEGLYQAVSGLGREMPPTTDGDYFDHGEIEPGLNFSFRPDATKIIAITTDAPFHQGGDPGTSFAYPGATLEEAIAELTANNVKVIAIKAPGSSTQMDDLADSTGGAVVYTSSTSAEIAQAILDGIDSLVYTVTASPESACAPLGFAYAPASHSDIPGGASVNFDETISVPLHISASDLDADGNIICDVNFKADDTVIGTQHVEVHVPLNNPPVANCADVSVSADTTCSADADVDAGAFDPDGDALVYSYSPEGPYPVGATEVTLTVTDTSGASDSCTATVTVVDDTPPTVVVGDALEMWPPNHKYVDFGLGDCNVTVTDSCSGDIDLASVGSISYIYSDEPEDAEGNGDGKTLDDIVIDGPASFALRAERAGGENGRVYGVGFAVSDGAGNVSEGVCLIGVPHSDDGTPAVDDGPLAGYIVNP